MTRGDFINWTEEQLKNYYKRTGQDTPQSNPKSPSKYRAKKTWAYGLCFDSQKEAEYFSNLRMLHRANVLIGYLFHGKFVLTEGEGMENRAITYEPDFILLFPDGTYRIVDTKGMETSEFKNKMKQLREKFPKVQIEIEKQS